MIVSAPAVVRRSGTAAVEMAIVFSTVILPILVGVMEVGRLVQVQQIVANAAREGARLAAQAQTLSSDGTITQFKANTGNPSVQSAAYQYLIGAGLTKLTSSDVTVTFAYTAPRSDGLTATEPYEGEKLQPFDVTVTVQYEKLKWINLGFIGTTSLSYTAHWQILVDDPFSVNVTMPSW
ncbi:MAG TPA: TadE/TadG family type IV pilus assembly protein [Fimbriiglobus sp.]|jgi:Flp pilus assembly protein TadG